MVEIFIGGWRNTKSVIRNNEHSPDVVSTPTLGILNAKQFRGFWIRWSGGVIRVGKKGEVLPFMTWINPKPFQVNFVGVSTGWGGSGSWIIEDDCKVTESQLAAVHHGEFDPNKKPSLPLTTLAKILMDFEEPVLGDHIVKCEVNAGPKIKLTYIGKDYATVCDDIVKQLKRENFLDDATIKCTTDAKSEQSVLEISPS